MWCKRCGQDVPGVSSAEEGKICCARCGWGLGQDSAGGGAAQGSQRAQVKAGSEAVPGDPAARIESDGPSHWDDWELDEQLLHIRRKLGAADAPSPEVQAACRSERARLDPGHAGPPAWHVAPQRKPAPGPSPDRQSTASMPAVTWAILSLGLMAFVCGAVLMGWSVATQRDELWSRGVPFAVVGQIALLVGLILQLERLWRDGRQTAAKLEHVDEELHGLRSTTAMLGTTHSSAASAFYCHMAGGANSQLLLSDLKGQLDMLALKIGQEQGREGRDEG